MRPEKSPSEQGAKVSERKDLIVSVFVIIIVVIAALNCERSEH